MSKFSEEETLEAINESSIVQGLFETRYAASVLRERTREALNAISQLVEQRDEARAVARVLAHAYENDNRPPGQVVERALAYPKFIRSSR